jgi:lauroyl/myristoyl acyltransferase
MMLKYRSIGMLNFYDVLEMLIKSCIQQITGFFKLCVLYNLRLISFFPLNVRYCITDKLSMVVFYVCRKKREAVARNLKLILERTPNTKEVCKVFIEYGRYWAEFFDVNRYWSDTTRIIDNPEFPPKDRNFLGLTFHLGNFELFGPALFPAIGGNFVVIAERLKPDFISEFFKKYRLKHHITTIFHDDKREILNALNMDNALGVVCDREVGGRGVEVRLFGKKVRLPLNVVSLALQKKKPIIVSYCVKNDNALKMYYQEIPADLSYDQTIELIVQILENAIRRYPLQWHVLTSI